MKKLLSCLCLLLALSFCVVLTSCGGEVEDLSGGKYVVDFSQSQKRKVTLRVWMDDSEGTVGRELEADFEGLHPDINLVFQHMGTVDAREKLKTYGQSGNGADIFQFPHDHMAQAILDDLVYALPDTMLDDVKTRLTQVALDIATISYNDQTHAFDPNGAEKLYAVPISLESVALYYNIDILKALWGEDKWEEHIPTTFTQFFADMEAYDKMTKEQKTYKPAGKTEAIEMGTPYFATSSHWADQYFIQFIYSAFGFRPFGENGNDDSAVGFEKESVTKALTWMMEELKPRIHSDNHNSISGQNEFETGKLPFVLTGPWAIPSFNGKVNYGVTTLPTINVDGEEKVTSTFAGAQMLAAYKYSNHREEAITFLSYMSTARAQQIIFNLGGDLPALNEAELANIEGLATNQPLQATIKQLTTSIPMPTIPAVTYYWSPGEIMVTNIWNSGAVIVNEQKTAENSYAAKKAGAE